MTLLLALQSEIKRWQEGGRNRTLKSLARKSGLSYATIRRFDAGEVRPQPHNVMKIIRVTRETAELVHGWVIEHMPEHSALSEQSASLEMVYKAFERSSATHAAIFRELSFGPCEESDLLRKFGLTSSRAIEEFILSKVARG